MPTVKELGLLSAAVYDLSIEMPSGWNRIDPRPAAGGLNGFQAARYQKGAEIVVAFRGTAQKVDTIADLQLGVGFNTSYFAQGDDYVEQYLNNPNVFVCGHSLGGAIAQVVANRGGFKFATFNAPGVAVFASKNIGELATSAALGTLKVRTVGMLVSAICSPIQAFKDMKAAFDTVHGLNVCLNCDVVSQIGVHYGDVIRIPGTSINPLTEHKIDTVNEVLENHPVGQQRVELF